MSGSITLHSKLGVNPRMYTVHCPLCGKKDEQLILLGSANYAQTCPNCKVINIGGGEKVKEAGRFHHRECCRCGAELDPSTRQELSDWEKFDTRGVCAECRGHMKLGIIITALGESTKAQTGSSAGRPITGYFVVKEEAVRRLFASDGPLRGNDKMRDAALKGRAMYMDEEVARMLGLFDHGEKGLANGGELPPTTKDKSP